MDEVRIIDMCAVCCVIMIIVLSSCVSTTLKHYIIDKVRNMLKKAAWSL